MGWVALLATPSWSSGVASLRDGIRDTTRELVLKTAMEDGLRWETCVGKDFSSSVKARNARDEGALYEEEIIEDTKFAMEEAVLRNDSTCDTVSVVVTPDAPDLNLVTKSDERIEAEIASCPYSFVSPLKTGLAPAISTAEAEEAKVPTTTDPRSTPLSQSMEVPVSLGEQIPPRVVSVESTKQEGTQHSMSFEFNFIDASELKKYSAPKVCVRLGINRLIKTMPSQGNGIIKKPFIVFFNQFHKEIEVKHQDIRDLRNQKTRLDNDVMDF